MAHHAPSTSPRDFDHLIQKGYEFRLGHYLNRGWELFKAYPWGFFGYSFIYMLLANTLFLAPHGIAGYYAVARKIDRGEKPEFGDFFDGFNKFGKLLGGYFAMLGIIFGLVLAAGLIVGLVAGIGDLDEGPILALVMFLAAIPILYLSLCYLFVTPILYLEDMGIWDSLETSRKIIAKNWGSFFLMGLAFIPIVMLGYLALGVGILVAQAVVQCAIYAAYDDITGGTLSTDETLEEKIENIGQEEF